MKRRLGIAVLGTLGFVAVLVLLRSHGDATVQDREAILAGASARHWAGTDDLGRDRAVRVAAALLGCCGAVCASAMTTAVAVAMGVGAAFAPGAVRGLVLYASDLFLALPWLFLLMLVRSVLPLALPAHWSAVLTFGLLAALGWPVYVRSLAARAEGLRDADWLLQARAGGLRTRQVLCTHLLPQLQPLYRTQFLLCMPAFLIAEANLGALGLGVSEPLVSWGTLLQELGSSAELAATRWVYLPVALLVIVLLSMEMLVPED